MAVLVRNVSQCWREDFSVQFSATLVVSTEEAHFFLNMFLGCWFR